MDIGFKRDELELQTKQLETIIETLEDIRGLMQQLLKALADDENDNGFLDD